MAVSRVHSGSIPSHRPPIRERSFLLLAHRVFTIRFWNSASPPLRANYMRRAAARAALSFVFPHSDQRANFYRGFSPRGSAI
eukprot:9497342-Pyramimonas_sp.AAC.1